MDLNEIRSFFKECLASHPDALQLRVDKPSQLEFAGTKRVMQGKQEVDGHYFASVVNKPKDVRLYFFPIYTHSDAYALSESMQKKLKGKSCFHVHSLNEEEKKEVREMIETGVKLYQRDGLI